jgi:hypothetical protein
MEVHLDSEGPAMAPRPRTGKPRRPAGRPAPSPTEVADQTGRVWAERESEWLGRLTTDPTSFAAVEREVPEPARHQADRDVAGRLAKASEPPGIAQHVAAGIAAAAVPLRPVEKTGAPWWSACWEAGRSR